MNQKVNNAGLIIGIKGLCNYLGCGRSTASKYLRDITHYQVGRRIYVREEDVMDFLETFKKPRQTEGQAAKSSSFS